MNHGEPVDFKIDTPATDYRLDIYRMGYYGGAGARKVATIQPSATAAAGRSRRACRDPATGLVDCGNWGVSASWTVPVDGDVGHLLREAGSRGRRRRAEQASHIFFVVRDDDGHSDLLFQTSDTTWQAYNTYGGNSLYVGSPARPRLQGQLQPAVRHAAAMTPQSFVFNAEYPMVRLLEAERLRRQLHDRRRHAIDPAPRSSSTRCSCRSATTSTGRAQQRANVEAARDAGVHLAFFSGNEVFWKTRWENSIDGSSTPHRTLVCYKETHANAKIDPSPRRGPARGAIRDSVRRPTAAVPRTR